MVQIERKGWFLAFDFGVELTYRSDRTKFQNASPPEPASTTVTHVSFAARTSAVRRHGVNFSAHRNRRQETEISVQFVPVMRFLVLEFGVFTALAIQFDSEWHQRRSERRHFECKWHRCQYEWHFESMGGHHFQCKCVRHE
eukprot:1787862-Rhodomonas_salina.2